MAYYMTGDYYGAAGDPGIFGFVGKALKTVGGFVPGVGGILQAAGGLLDRPSAPATRRGSGLGQALMLPGGGPRPTGISLGQRLRTAGQALVPGGVEPGAGCPPGYHLDKQTGTKCVKNRRMNPGNAKALRRSIRREAAFIGLAKRSLKGSGYTFKRTGVARKRKR